MVKKVLIALVLSVLSVTILFAEGQSTDASLPLLSEYRDVSVVKNEGGIYKKGRHGFHYGNDILFKYNRVEAYKDTSGKATSLSFDCMVFDDDLFVGYMFNDIIGLYLKMNTTVDIANFNDNFYKLNSRFGISGKFGPRVYYTPATYIDAEFLFGRLMYTHNWSSYNVLGLDASFGFEVFGTEDVAMDIKLTFSYRRTPYSNEYGAGFCMSVECF